MGFPVVRRFLVVLAVLDSLVAILLEVVEVPIDKR
jgi:hypothetical protein